MLAILLLSYTSAKFYSDAIIYTHHIIIQNRQGPIINDPHLKAELLVSGINFPTSMAFVGANDILVLEKNNGTVQRIINGKMLAQPLLKVNVDTKGERGMLGIAVAENGTQKRTYVFLYYTEAVTKSAEDVLQGKNPVCACLYRYELANNRLINPVLLLSLAASPGFYHEPDHLGGKILVGPDHNIYLGIGDVGGHMTQAENVLNGGRPDGTGGILRVTEDGHVVPDSPLGGTYPQDLYYAYGIRNIFGMDFDPVTEKLWDSENGPSYGDEINLVEPGFNSGWVKVQGIWKPVPPLNYFKGNITLHPDKLLVDFGGKGKYRAPEFIWDREVGPTALRFLNSDKLGKPYENEMFVGDFHYGNLYHFKLSTNRTGLILNGLYHNVATSAAELRNMTFANGFGGITDIQVGPDGYLYILSLYAGGDDCNPIPELYNKPCISYSSSIKGSIFKIVPAN